MKLSPHERPGTASLRLGCAREVTAGRITGLLSSSVDGTPALLVYTKADGSTQVTVRDGLRWRVRRRRPSAVLPR